jgi:hypothetical protein
MVSSEAHEVCVMCRCDDIEHCHTERYIADVRSAYAEIVVLEDVIARMVGDAA